MACSETDGQPAGVLRIKSEPLDDSQTDDGFHQFHAANNPEGEVDFRCDFTYEPGTSADLRVSPVGPEPLLVNSLSEKKQTPYLSNYVRALRQSANTSPGKQSQNESYRCRLCFATFELFSFFKQHMASVHGENIQNVLAMSSTPKGHSDVGPCGRMAIDELKAAVTKSVASEKDQAGRNETDRTGLVNDWSTVIDAVNKRKDKADIAEADGTDLDKDKRQHICDVCDKAFTRIDSLKRHKMIHTGLEKQFVCDECSQAFTRSSDLKQHKFIHTGHRDYECDVCKKAFARSSSLKRHKLIHIDEKLKPFVCDQCGKAFMEAGHLKTHKIIHTGQKKFVCDICSKAFTLACNLKQHKLIHTGEKPHVCDVCDKAFTEAGHLKRHKLIHTGDKKYVCDVCNRAFTQASTLKRHKKTHGEEEEEAESLQVSSLMMILKNQMTYSKSD